MAQASEYLGAVPVDTWRRTDGSVLARWAYKGSALTDAVYFRQEAWLLFGPDGTFQRTENAINMPLMNHTRTQAEADRAAAEVAARQSAAVRSAAQAEVRAHPDTVQSLPAATQPNGIESAQTVPVQPPPALTVTPGNALLPVGTTYTPGVNYPISQQR